MVLSTEVPSKSQEAAAKTIKAGETAEADIPYIWLLKPCWYYQEEHRDCWRIRERFNQYFIFGELKDCTPWKADYKNCRIYEKTQDIEAVTKVLDNEQKRARERIKNHYKNDIWENRETPPKDWNKELPPEISQGYLGSYLYARRELDQVNVEQTEEYTERLITKLSRCVIM